MRASDICVELRALELRIEADRIDDDPQVRDAACVLEIERDRLKRLLGDVEIEQTRISRRGVGLRSIQMLPSGWQTATAAAVAIILVAGIWLYNS